MDLGLGDGLWPWVWLAVGIILIVLELTPSGGSLLIAPFGAAALLAAVIGFVGADVAVQWVIAVGGGALILLVVQRYRALVHEGSRLPPGVGATRLVGLTGVVTRTVEPDDTTGVGTVLVTGETWHALTEDSEPLIAGTPVRVVSVEGTRVRVTRDTTTVGDGLDADTNPGG